MKTTKILLIALTALSTFAASLHAEGVHVVYKPTQDPKPASAIASTKVAQISALEQRVVELEAMAKASDAKLAAIEKRLYQSTRPSVARATNRNARR